MPGGGGLIFPLSEDAAANVWCHVFIAITFSTLIEMLKKYQAGARCGVFPAISLRYIWAR